MISVLLKKQLTEKLSAFKKDKKHADYLGVLLSVLLVAGLIGVCVLVLSKFYAQYSKIRLYGVTDVAARQFELLTIIYSVIMLIGVLGGVKNLNFALYESEDRKIFVTLPIKSSDVFYSKLIVIYLKQVVTCALTVMPVNFTFAAISGQSAYYVLMTFVMCLFFPVITLSFASVLAIPYYYVKRFFDSRYAVSLLTATAVTGLVFWWYSTILSFVKTLLTTGEIKFFFNEKTMTGVIRAANVLYPSNLFAKVLLKTDVGKNIGILIAILAGAGALGYLIISLTYNKTSQIRAMRTRPIFWKQRGERRQKSPFTAFFAKEFGLVFRTPSYAFQYFSVAAVMPLMVYFCMGIGSDLLTTIVLTENNFELALFLILIFGALTNTFCATNVSREGPAFYTIKTMPVKFSTVLGAKIAFCSVVSFLSTAVSVIVVSAKGYINVGEAFFVLFVALTLGEAQICFATRKDLNRPSFSTDEDCEVRESNSTVSEIVFLGLITAAVLGGVSLFLSVFTGKIGSSSSSLYSMLFSGLGATVLFALALTYMLVGLNKKVARLTEGN